MGEGVLFYRCTLCGGVVSPWDIHEHGKCRKCGNTKVFATNLTVIEKLVQLFKHPAIWRWGQVPRV
jgi:hypothetical protein